MYGFLRVLALLIIIGLIGLAGFWFVTRPDTLPDDTFTALSGDAEAGEAVFWAGGCASCHAAPGAEGDEERLVLAGGQTFATEFGSFVAPNISPTEAGIAGWSVDDLGNAMMRGVSPEGQHYYPAFPYTSYSRAAPQDIADLHAFLQTLPASDVANQPHDIGFPFSIRRLLGGWKMRAGATLSNRLATARSVIRRATPSAGSTRGAGWPVRPRPMARARCPP